MSDIPSPADPSKTLSYRMARLAVIVLSALIILALIGLVVGTVMKLSGRSTRVIGGSQNTAAFVLPPGAKIVSSETEGGRVVLHVTSPAGEEIDILSTDDGHLIAQIKAAPPPTPARQ